MSSTSTAKFPSAAFWLDLAYSHQVVLVRSPRATLRDPASRCSAAATIASQPDGVAHGTLAAAGQERVGHARAVGSDQHLRAVGNAGGRSGVLGQLRQREVQYGQVIGGGVAAGVAWAQDPGQGFTAGDIGAVQEHQQRVEPEAVLVGRGLALLLTVRGQQTRIHVHD